MRVLVPLFALSALVIGLAWAWLGAPVAMPESPVGRGEKLYCVSYAPFRGNQSPLDPSTQISPAQIADDLERLARITNCVRTYSVDFGLDRVAEIAGRYGLKVIQGLWLSGLPDKNRYQIETAVALANKYPNIIRSVVVGNEVLLRGEMAANDLAATIRAVKARVPVPVTYADVWEFWLRNRNVADAADFIMIHILPYWEDFPIPARYAAAHVDSIRRRVVQAMAGQEVVIGEVGWPSAGRMREGALPSLANQARVIQEVLALSKRDNFNVNVIEAFDQPWKRALEGTVGGHWGLLDDASRDFKFEWGKSVSNHAHWRWQAAGGVAFALLIFAAGFAAGGRARPSRWIAVAAVASVGGICIGLVVENVPLESLGLGGWTRSLALAAVAFLAPPLCAAAITSGRQAPAFWQVVGRLRVPDLPMQQLALGVVLIATTALAIIVALGLTFDPRYKDFPYAPLGAAAVSYILLSALRLPRGGARPAAELVAAGLLALCAGYILFNEGFANWQSLLVCAELLALAVTLARVRGVPG
jgi:glucan 1,3-beta-glucosidase